MEEILYYIAYILETVFETYVIARLMGMFLEYTPEKKKYILGAYLVRIILCVQYILFPQAGLNLLIYLIAIVLIALLYDGKIAKKMTVAALVIMCQMISELIAVVYLTLKENTIKLKVTGHNGDIFTLVLIALALWIISEIMHTFRNIQKESPVPKLFSASMITFSIFLFVLQATIFLGETLTESIKLLSVLCILMAFFLLIYLYDALSQIYTESIQVELVEREKNYYYKQAELLQRSSIELSAFRHDSMNHLYALQSMLSTSDEAAKLYMEKLIGKMQEVKAYCKTGNIVVDSVINYKLGVAKQKHIEVVSIVMFPEHLDFMEEDLVTILGNLLDNAIEAAEKIEGVRYIYFEMKYKAGVLFIDVKNSYDGKLVMQNGEIKTRKQNTKYHGIGLKSVRSTVENYGGSMDIKHDEKEFEVNVMLYV